MSAERTTIVRGVIDPKYVEEGIKEKRRWRREQLARERELRRIIVEVTNKVITPEQIFADLKALQAPAPSGTVLYTRTPIIRRLLEQAGVPPTNITDNFLDSQSPAVFLDVASPYEDPNINPLRKTIWFSAHADQPTYLPYTSTEEKTFNIMPICAHRPKITGKGFPEFPAIVLRYNSQKNKYEVVSKGTIGTRDEKSLQPYYKTDKVPKDGFDPWRDRITYNPPLTFDKETGLAVGNIDNAAGIAASIAAIRALTVIADNFFKMDPSYFNVGWLCPDSEEGLPDDPAYFGREARSIIHKTGGRIATPNLIFNIDGHDTSGPPPATALYGVYVSRGKGPVSSPDMYRKIQERYFLDLSKYGIALQPTGAITGSLSRSDDAAYMEKTYTTPLGYGVRDPHHNEGWATVNIDSLVNVAKIMTWIAANSGLAGGV